MILRSRITVNMCNFLIIEKNQDFKEGILL